MNLEKLNLEELNAQEVETTDGGSLPPVNPIWGWFGAITVVYSFVTGLNDGIHEGESCNCN